MYAPLLLFRLNSIDYIVPVFVVYCCRAVPLRPHPLAAMVLHPQSISFSSSSYSSFPPHLHYFPHAAVSLYDDEVMHFNFHPKVLVIVVGLHLYVS